MHLVSRLRRASATTIVLLGLLAGLGIASAQADAPILDRQTPRVSDGTSATLPNNPTDTPLSSPSPIQTTTPLSTTPGTPSPATPSSTAGTPDSAGSSPAKPSDKTDAQAAHTVRFDPADGGTPTQASVKTGTLAAPPQENPQREGFRFDGWTLDGQPYDFRTPVLQDTTLKARWSKTTDWTLSPEHGPATGARLTISPPSPQKPCYVSVQAAGEQILGLTGDGRIHTWTQDHTPVQVPAPAQASDGFRYLQAAAGSRRQAALESDQRIYTWDSRQTTPTLLDTGQDAGFTSISINDDRLLAVDRQGQIHAIQNSQEDSRDQKPKPAEQATTSLPGQAQAVTAAASGSRTLIVDADGQAWIWDTSNTRNVKPEPIKQDPGTRIVQAQALNQGFLLLDANGQAWYLAYGKSSPTAAGLPNSEQIGRINSGEEQTIIVDKDGHIWAWKPGSKPIRADDGSRPYMQAASTGGRVTAVDRQGSMFTWGLDGQGRPGKPVSLDTVSESTLESASMDGKPLTLARNNGSWQTDIPARKPGSTIITITGKQDNRPFTRSLTYTVDQPLTRDAEPRSTFTVRFDTGGGNPEPADQHFPAPYGRVKRPFPDPARQGFLFDGWFIGQAAYDFSRPVTKDLTLTAKWTESRNSTWSISPDKGSQLGNEATTITPPDSARRGIRFSQISGSKYNGDPTYGFSLAVGSDGNAYAWGYNRYGQLGDGTTTTRTTPVKVSKPVGAPTDFTYVQVSGGYYHSLAIGSDGYAYAWGRSDSGQLGNNTTTTYSSVPVRVRDPTSPTDKNKGLKAIQVSAGGDHSLAVGSDGNAYAWGSNGSGQLGDGTYTTRTTPVKVSKPADAPTNFTYVQVSGGYNDSLAVGSDGNAYGCGDNTYGKLGDGTSTSRAMPVKASKPADAPTDFTYIQISAGAGHSLAVGSDGYAYAWGRSDSGQLGNNTSGFGAHSSVPVHVRDPSSPTDENKGLKATQVSGGGDHSLAVGSDGYVYAWGINNYGQLGNNTTSGSTANPVPVHVRNPANSADTSKGLQATQVKVGYDFSLAMGSDGNAYAWGANGNGQLGNDTTNTKLVPVPVVFNLQLVITGVKFDTDSGTNLTRGDGSSVIVTTPAHAPGMVTVSVDYTLGGAPQKPDTSLRYTYTPLGVLPQAGGEGILLALATGMTGMGGVLASRRHRGETRQLFHTSHE